MNILSNTKKQSAFSIVELLIVVIIIVVIGILAVTAIMSYISTGNKDTVMTLQSDLSNASTEFKTFQKENGVYPVTISTNCDTEPTTTTNLCLKTSAGNSFTTVAYKNPTPQSFILTEVNGNNTYHITENSTVTNGLYAIQTLATTDPDNWLIVGTQVWAKHNINVGTMVTGLTAQTNNGGTNIIEKYCYNNLEANCTTYGGLYQWNEAMNYSRVKNTQGICPDNSHIPSDNDLKVLEVQLGLTQLEADATSWRGTDQGSQLKNSDASSLSVPLAGLRDTDGSFDNMLRIGDLWSSSENGDTLGWYRGLDIHNSTVYRNLNSKKFGFSVRCIGN